MSNQTPEDIAARAVKDIAAETLGGAMVHPYMHVAIMRRVFAAAIRDALAAQRRRDAEIVRKLIFAADIVRPFGPADAANQALEAAAKAIEEPRP